MSDRHQLSDADDADLPRTSTPLLRGFNWYVPRYFRRHFNAVRMANCTVIERVPHDEAIVCFANHPSWWDPLLAFLISQVWLPGRTVYAPIDLAALRQYPIFQHLGFFGIERASVEGTKQFLRVSKRLLRRPSTALWMTPSGQFDDVRRRSAFQPGLGHLAASVDRVTFLPVAWEYPFWNERTPEALVEFGIPARSDRGRDKADWHADLEQRLASAQKSLAEKAMARDAGRFEYTLGGSAGVGGWYDLLRRFQAFLCGKPFEARHQS